MKRGGAKNVVASAQARLLERSREPGVEHQLTLARFGGERLLYRLSRSEFADRFILKGAALLLLWLGEPIRPTKDIDLLVSGTRLLKPSSASRACPLQRERSNDSTPGARS